MTLHSRLVQLMRPVVKDRPHLKQRLDDPVAVLCRTALSLRSQTAASSIDRRNHGPV